MRRNEGQAPIVCIARPASSSAWRFVEVVVVKAAKKQYVSLPVRVT